MYRPRYKILHGLLREGDNISKLTLEQYPGMTEKALAEIEAQVNRLWELTVTLIIHRVGPLLPNDNIVLVVVASLHRKQAFEACEFMIDILKTRAPFWKRSLSGTATAGLRQTSTAHLFETIDTQRLEHVFLVDRL